MGGKSKQAQRTKNNARPSSSGRSAELLGSFGKGVAAGTALFPTLAAVAPDAALTPDLALCIKKLNKKDPITKAKALQELNELVQNSKVDDVAAMLPNWTYYYKILSVDPDRRVRELTQVCHGSVVGVCGRRVAPQLKALLPAWLAAQLDEHAPARSRAQHTLNNTFPDNKLPDAISFCKAEILAHIADSLLDPSASVSRKLDSEDERDSAVTRVLVGALGGLLYIAGKLPESHSSWLWDQLTPILKNNAFWKLAGHSASEVRAAWYNAIGGLSHRFGAQWGAAHGQRASRLIVSAREGGAAAQAQWGALARGARADREWYSRLDKKELLAKRFLQTVEGGGWGCAAAMAEIMPDLLQSLPAEALTSEFCSSLFDAYFTGYELRSVMGTSERGMWMVCAALSLWEVCGRGDLAPDAGPRALARCAQAALARPQLLHALTRILARWARIPHQELLLRSFWQNVSCTIQAQVVDPGTARDPARLSATLDKHTDFLRTMHKYLNEEPKKPKGVRFADEIDSEETNETIEPPTEPPTKSKQDLEATQLLTHQLDECVQRVCVQYMELARENGGLAECIVKGLMPVLSTVGKGVWAAMGEALAGRPGSPFLVFECGLQRWLSREDSRGEAVVKAVFLLMHHLTEDEQIAVFTAFDKLDADACDWILPPATTCEAAGAEAWLRGGVARAAILRATRRALAGDGQAEDMLMRCLKPLPNGDLLCGEDTSSEVQQLVAYVVSSNSALGSSARLMARLLGQLAHRASLATDQLIAAQVTHQLNQIDSSSSADWSPRALWLDGVLALPPPRRAALLLRCTRLVLDHLPTGPKDLETNRIVQCASLAAHLATCCDDHSTALALLQPHADRSATTHALRSDIVFGTLNCPFDDKPIVRSAVSAAGEAVFSVSDALPFLRWCVFRAAVVRALCGASPRCPLEHPPALEAYAALLHDRAVVRSLKDGYAFVADYELVVSTDSHLSSIISDVASLTPAPLLAALGTVVSARAAAEGLYWARAAGALRAADCTAATTGDGLCHMLQAALYSASPDAATPSVDSQWSTRFRTLYGVMARSLHAAHAHSDAALATLLQPERMEEPSADVIVDAYYRREATMLYDTDISEAPWVEAVLAASVADFLAALVEEHGWEAPSHHWDFVTISLCSLLASVDKAKRAWGRTQVAMVIRPVLQLLGSVRRFVLAVPSEAQKRQPSEHVAALPREWADVFAPTVNHHVYSLLLHILEEAPTCTLAMTSPRARVLAALCAALKHVSWSALPAASRAAFPLQRLTAAGARALAARTHHAHLYLAHCTLAAHRADSVLSDAEKLREWSDANADSSDAQPAPELTLHALDEPLAAALADQHDALQHLVVGEDTCEVLPHSEEHSLALGWLLLVEALGSMTLLQRGELSLHYAELVREKKYTSLLLPAALRLLPPDVAQYAMDPSNSAHAPKAGELFLTVKEFSIDEPSLSSDVSSLACRALYLSMSGYGAGEARGWWGAASGRGARALARLATAYVTPTLVRLQLKAVAERKSTDLPDTEVAVHWSASEVTCCVYVEERRVELSISLPAMYPLVLPTVTAPPPHPHSPAPSTHWLAVYLAYQNGSLLTALRMWVTAVTARVEAAPQCYICYCRLHPTSGRLPSVPCHQCRNKFHPHCLRKWFTTSNKSNCPLCRASF